jgi:hypothetical protein
MGLAEGAIREQVDRILHSKALEGSDVHRRLLTYLADKTLSGEAERLKEYTVALDALGKPATYDPRHDSVVRLQVGRLRVKLAEYYQNEGTTDPIAVALPKGGFKLSFASAAPELATRPAPPPERSRLVLGLVAAVAVLAGWGTYAAIRIHNLSLVAAPVEELWNDELKDLWAPFLDAGRPLTVCIGTPLFVRFPNMAFVRDPGSNEWDQLASSSRFATIRKALPGFEAQPWFSFTGVGEASGAFQLGKLLGTRRRDIRLTRSNLLSWAEISDSDLVFVGPPKFNTQLQSIPIEQEVRLETDGIRILHPQKGEPAFLKDTFQPGAQFDGMTHAVISCTPGLSGQGELLILGGNASPDTYAATQWVTQPWRARQLVNRLRQGSGTLPRYFQAVIKVEFKNGTPVESEYVLHRVLQASAQGGAKK